MHAILKAELSRLRSWALAFGLLHLGLLAFLSRLMDLAQLQDEAYFPFAAAHALAGVLLGLYQMGGYRQPNAWLNLLHRPLAPARIAAALIGAGVLLLALAVLLPMLLIVGWQAGMSARVLDLRHALLAVAGFDWALLGYLAGAAAMLVPRRAAVAPLVPVLLLPAAHAAGPAALAIQWLAIAWLLALLIAAFKPDLSTWPRGVGALLLALPLMVLMWLLLHVAGAVHELAWMAEGSHPDSLPVAPVGSVRHAAQAEGAALFAAGLQDAAAAEVPLWRAQAAISEILSIGLAIPEGPTWHELTNRAPMAFVDQERRLRWVFSHDRGRFIGFDQTGARTADALGVEGDGRFAWPPLRGPGDLLLARDVVYQYVRDEGRVLPRVVLPAGEMVAGADLDGERLALLSSAALYLYDARPLRQSAGRLTTRQRVPLPGASGNLQRVDILELEDGHLVSMLFTRLHEGGQGPAFQALLRVHEDGRVQEVANRALASGYGPLFTWRAWWYSPALTSALRAGRRALAADQPGYLQAPPPRPKVVDLLAGVLMLVSLGAAVWRVRGAALSPRGRWAWCSGCALVGLPALMALWWAVPLRETVAPRRTVAVAAG